MSWGPHSSFERERQIRCRLFTSIKRKIRDFHAVVVQWRQRNVQKRVLHVQSCCFANQTYCFYGVLAAVDTVVAKAPYYVLDGFSCRQEELPGIDVQIYMATYHCAARRSWVTGWTWGSLDTLSSSGSCRTLLKLNKRQNWYIACRKRNRWCLTLLICD